jgi:tRNA (cmo5U34)-methyltransferase
MKRDSLYNQPRKQVVDFAFDDAVVDVFPDMIRRSVPGYETIISLLGTLGDQYAQADSRIYDLGCSLGASTLSLYQQLQAPNLQFIGVDNAPAMIEQCKQNLQKHMPDSQHQILCQNIEDTEISNASVIVINFTLQFLPLNARLKLLEKIYQGLLPNGCLILSEKIQYTNPQKQGLLTDWHHAFKRANHYSDLEISQKRTSLENVLIPETVDTHLQRLQEVGFKSVEQWFQCFTFSSFMAIK